MMTATPPTARVDASEVTARAVAFVAAHRDAAEALGHVARGLQQRPGRLRDRA